MEQEAQDLILGALHPEIASMLQRVAVASRH